MRGGVSLPWNDEEIIVEDEGIGQYDHLTDEEFGKSVRQGEAIYKNIGRVNNPVPLPHGQKLIAVPDDQETEKDFRDSWGNYSVISKMKTNYARTTSKDDLFDLLDQVSKSTFHLFVELKLRLIPKTNLVHYPLNKMTKSEVSSFNRKLKELIDVGVFKRARTIDEKHPVRMNSLMMNPYLVVPKKNAGDIRQEWDLMDKPCVSVEQKAIADELKELWD